MTTLPRLLVKVGEAAQILSISEKTLWSLSAPRGPIPVVRVGERSVRYSVDALRNWIAQQHGESTGTPEQQ